MPGATGCVVMLQGLLSWVTIRLVRGFTMASGVPTTCRATSPAAILVAVGLCSLRSERTAGLQLVHMAHRHCYLFAGLENLFARSGSVSEVEAALSAELLDHSSGPRAWVEAAEESRG